MGAPRNEARVRFVPGAGFEMQCRSCLIYVALDESLWWPKSGLTRCRACWNEYHRLHEAGRRKDEIVAELKRTRARLDYAMNREKRREANRAWKAANRERIAAYNKAYRERNREKVNAESRAYYAECRDVILAKKRESYAEARAA